MSSDISIIAAMTEERVIGRNNRLPWCIPEELLLFKRLTLGSTVVMGRRTFQSIGHPLPGRYNIVLSRTIPHIGGAAVAGSLEDALTQGKAFGANVFIIGGAEVFQEALPLAGTMYISWIRQCYEGDAYFPDFNRSDWQLRSEKHHELFTFAVYDRRHTRR